MELLSADDLFNVLLRHEYIVVQPNSIGNKHIPGCYVSPPINCEDPVLYIQPDTPELCFGLNVSTQVYQNFIEIYSTFICSCDDVEVDMRCQHKALKAPNIIGVINGLRMFLGDAEHAGAVKVLLRLGIGTVINVAEECKFDPDDRIERNSIVFRDRKDAQLPIQRFVEEMDHIDRSHAVLVNCRMGMSRSCSLIAAYAMVYNDHWDTERTVRWIRSKRKQCKPNRGFLKQLRQHFGNRKTLIHFKDMRKYLKASLKKIHLESEALYMIKEAIQNQIDAFYIPDFLRRADKLERFINDCLELCYVEDFDKTLLMNFMQDLCTSPMAGAAFRFYGYDLVDFIISLCLSGNTRESATLVGMFALANLCLHSDLNKEIISSKVTLYG